MNIITLKQKKDLLISVFGEGTTSGDGKDIAFQCPICKKSPKAKNKRKLSISIETGIYHCWVCESKGKNISFFVKKNIPNFSDLDKLRDFFGIEKDDVEQEEEKAKIYLPPDFKLLALSDSFAAKRIKKYLKKRGMTEEDLYRFKVGYSEEFGFDNRAIFVSLNKDLDLNFYVTRSINDDIKFGKYKNCDASKKDIIFNEHLIDWEKPVILVEGIFDAVKAGENSIPVLGSWIDESYEVFKKIVENKADVILGFDPDAKNKEIKIASLLFKNGINVKMMQNLDKDLGDSSSKEIKILMDNAKQYDNIERMKYLIRGITSGSMY